MKKLLLYAAVALALSPSLAHAQSAGTVSIGQVAGANTPSAVSALINAPFTNKVDTTNGVASNLTVNSGLFAGITISSGNVTGAFTVPTPAAGDNSALAVNSAWVRALFATYSGGGGTAGVTSINGSTGAVTPGQIAAAATAGYGYTPTSPSSLATALALYAALNSPALTGTPTAPNQPANTDNNTIATTLYADRSAANAIATIGGRTVSNPLLLTSAGTSLATATVLTANENIAGTCSTGAFRMPTGTSIGQQIYLNNASGAACSLYPDTNLDNFLNLVPGAPVTLTAGATVSIANGASARITNVSATEWLVVSR